MKGNYKNFWISVIRLEWIWVVESEVWSLDVEMGVWLVVRGVCVLR